MFLKRIVAVLKRVAELTPEQLALFEQWEHYAKTLPYRFPNVDQDELSSIAYESLFKAVQSFDPSKGIAFTTYVTTIFNNAAVNAFKEQKQHRTKEISIDTPVGGGDEGEGLDLKEVIEDIHDISASDEVYFDDLVRFLKTKLEPFWFDFAEEAIESGKFMEAVRATNEKHNEDHLPQYYNQMMRKKILPAIEEFTGRNYKEEKEKREKAKVETEVTPVVKIPEEVSEMEPKEKEESVLSPKYYEKVQQPLIEDEEDKSVASLVKNILKSSALNLIAETEEPKSEQKRFNENLFWEFTDEARKLPGLPESKIKNATLLQDFINESGYAFNDEDNLEIIRDFYRNSPEEINELIYWYQLAGILESPYIEKEPKKITEIDINKLVMSEEQREKKINELLEKGKTVIKDSPESLNIQRQLKELQASLNLIAEIHTYDLVVSYGEENPSFIDGLIIDLGGDEHFGYLPEQDTQIEGGRFIKYIRYGVPASSEQEAINILLKIFQEYDGEDKGSSYGDGIVSVTKSASLNLTK